jgi:hypothetical protein
MLMISHIRVVVGSTETPAVITGCPTKLDDLQGLIPFPTLHSLEVIILKGLGKHAELEDMRSDQPDMRLSEPTVLGNRSWY